MHLREASLGKSVLVLEDDAVLSSALTDFLEDEGWEVQRASTAREAQEKLSENVFDLVLADYLLPDAHGITIFEEIQNRSPLTKVMLMTGLQDMEVAALAFKKGASDLISKPFRLAELERRIDLLMIKNPALPEAQDIKAHSANLPNIVGNSPAIQRLSQLVDLVAGKNATVLITGESGTGKELVARAIHSRSSRSKNPFVAINCGAIPENLLEDELFGHVRGAYTDARQPRIGKFEQAHEGTLFLDEIGTMSLSLQVKLLRVLEERSFERLGSNDNIKVDVRIVTATNADIKELVRKGEFREDLYYRLNVVPIHLSPLRERKDDLPLLVNHFLKSFCCEHQLEQKKIDPQALKLCMRHQWFGNVRELKNVIELACLLSDAETVLGVDHFPSLAEFDDGEPVEVLEEYLQLPEEGIDLNQVVSEVEKKLICQSLERTGGNKGKAARLLFLKRTTLVEKLRRMNLLEQAS